MQRSLDHYTCRICFNFYNENIRQPKILDCGHNFCKYCITQQADAYKNNNPNDKDDEEDGNQQNKVKIQCPTCRAMTMKESVEKLITIFDMLPQLDQQKYNTKFSKRNVFCTKEVHHSQQNANYLCQQCQHFLCKECHQKHLAMGCNDNHNSQSTINQEQESTPNRRPRRKIRTPLQYRESKEENNSHHFRSSGDIVNDLNNRVAQIINPYQMNIDNIHTNLETLQKIEAFVKNQGEKLRDQIRQEYQQVLLIVKELEKSRQEMIKGKINEAFQYINEQKGIASYQLQQIKQDQHLIMRNIDSLTTDSLSELFKQGNIEQKINQMQEQSKQEIITAHKDNTYEQTKIEVQSYFQNLGKTTSIKDQLMTIINDNVNNKQLLGLDVILKKTLDVKNKVIKEVKKTGQYTKKRELKEQQKIKQQEKKAQNNLLQQEIIVQKIPVQEILNLSNQVQNDIPTKETISKQKRKKTENYKKYYRGKKRKTPKSVKNAQILEQEQRKSTGTVMTKTRKQVKQNQSIVAQGSTNQIEEEKQNLSRDQEQNQREHSEFPREQLIKDKENEQNMNYLDDDRFMQGSTQATIQPDLAIQNLNNNTAFTPSRNRPRAFLAPQQLKQRAQKTPQTSQRDSSQFNTPKNISRSQVHIDQGFQNDNKNEPEMIETELQRRLRQAQSRTVRNPLLEEEKSQEQNDSLQNTPSNNNERIDIRNNQIVPMLRSNLTSPNILNSQETINENSQIETTPIIQFILNDEKQILTLNPKTLEWSIKKWNYIESHDLQNNAQRGNNLVFSNTACAAFPNNPNKMLITGGPCKKSVFVVTYDQQNNTVDIQQLREQMNVSRQFHQLVVCNNAFYAIGGDNGIGEVLKSVERFRIPKNLSDLPNQKWELVSQMGQRRTQFAAVAANQNQNIIVMGSGGPQQYRNRTFEIYDSHSDRWTSFHKVTLPNSYQFISALFLTRVGDRERVLIFGTPDSPMNFQNDQFPTQVLELKIEMGNSQMINNIQIINKASKAACLNERRIVRENVFKINDKILILGGNNSKKNGGEYMDLLNPNQGFKLIQSYSEYSGNLLYNIPSGTFHQRDKE